MKNQTIINIINKFKDIFKSENYFTNKTIIITLIITILFRIIITFAPSFTVDIGGYKAWANYLAQNGFDNIYKTFHIVYAPVYLYFLWFAGMIKKLFSLSEYPLEYIIKIISVLSDFIGAYFIYLIAKKYNKLRYGFVLGIVYVLNPAIFFNSSIWAQFDSFQATMLIAVIYLFIVQKNVIASVLFGVAILTKPQSALLLPIILVLFFKKFSWRNSFLILIYGICAYIIITVPFASGRPVHWVITHTIESGGDYPYATANGFNLWTLLGGQCVHDTQPFIGLSYASWSLLGLFIISIISACVLIKRIKSINILYYSAYFLCFGIFMLGSRMHERYMFPVFVFFTVCLLWNSKLWIPYIILSLCHFANQWYIYYMFSKKNVTWIGRFDKFAIFIAAISMIVYLFSAFYYYKIYKKEKGINTY